MPTQTSLPRYSQCMGRGSGDEEEATRAAGLELPLALAPRSQNLVPRYEQGLQHILRRNKEHWNDPQLDSELERFLLVTNLELPDRAHSRWELECFATLQETTDRTLKLLREERAFQSAYDLAAYDPTRPNIENMAVGASYTLDILPTYRRTPRPAKAYAARNGEKLYALYPQIEAQDAGVLNGEKHFVAVIATGGSGRIRLQGWHEEESAEKASYVFWTGAQALVAMYDLYGEGQPERVPLRATLQMRHGRDSVTGTHTFP